MATRTSHVSLLIIFQLKLRVCLTRPPSHSNGHMLNKEMVLRPIPLEPGYVKYRPNVVQSLVNIRPLRVRFGSRGGDASTHRKTKIPLLYWRADLGVHTKPMRARKPERCYIAGRYKVTNEINILTICDHIFFGGGGGHGDGFCVGAGEGAGGVGCINGYIV